METNLASFTDILSEGIPDSQPLSLSSTNNSLQRTQEFAVEHTRISSRPEKHTGQHGEFRSVEEIDPKYREVFTYPFFNLVQSRVIEDALYSDKSIVVCAPTGSGKTVVFEMAIVQLLMEIDEKKYDKDFKIIYMAPVKALCTERLTEWYSKFTKLGLLCIEVTGDTDVDVSQLKPYRVIITTPEKWDMLTRRWRDHRGLVELIKLFLIDEVHILNDEARGPVLEAVVSRMKTIESSTQSEYRIEQLQRQYQSSQEANSTIVNDSPPPRIRFVAVSATVSNPEDVATWLGNNEKPAVYYKFGDECRPVKLKRVVEGYPCPDGTSIFKFDIILNYKLWPIIQKYHDGKPTLIFCNTRKSVTLTAEALSREITISFNPEQRAKLTAIASTIKNKKLQSLVLAGVGCHHAGLLFEERVNIENAFRNRDLPILITTTTLAMGVNLPAHLVIIKNTQQYVNGAYQEYSISTVLQMVGRAGRPQFDNDATAVIMTRMSDKTRYEALVCGSEPLQSYLHKRLPENLNSEAALGTVNDVAQCVQWLRSTFLYVRAARDPKRYLGLPNNAPNHLISKKIEELCVRAMNGLATAGLISMDEASCIESTEAGRLMSIFYLDLETMKHIMKIEGTATLEQVLWVICESHELADMHLRVDERRCLNALNRNNAAPTIRFPMKGKISTRQMKLNCVIQAVLGCLPISDASLNQEAMKIMRMADRICKCLVAYVTRPDLISGQPKFYSAVLNSLILAKCIAAHIWENSPYVSKQLKGIGPTFSTLLATAGKINFMLLEESHPRDLERIMNKGPPAGNVLRKQISLLPKYQITMTPVDEKVVTMQLKLLNHNYLAENIENLTAGERHKCYIIVGDSENHLLLLKSFQDKDLIGLYDGIITHEIKRKHIFEHKIIVHCVSSLIVGIDAQCEYIFKNLDPAPKHGDENSFFFNNYLPANKTREKQTYITDIYKERKRKSIYDAELSQSKEKKKRESALAEKIRLLKESFGRASKEAKKKLQKSTEISNKTVHEISGVNESVSFENTVKLPQESICCENIIDRTDFTECNASKYLDNVNPEDFEMTESIDDTKINDILKGIESEISKEVDIIKDSNTSCNNKNVNSHTRNCFDYLKSKKLANISKKPQKSNFNFLELLDKNVNFNDDEDNKCMNDTGFSDAISSHIEKYLQQTKFSSKTPDILMDTLIEGKSVTKKTDHDTESVIKLPSEDFSTGKNETILKPVQMKSEFDININDLTKTEDVLIDTETKLNVNTTKSFTPSDTTDPQIHSHKTLIKKIDNIEYLNTITNNIGNIVLNQNLKQGLSCKLQDSIKNDNNDVTLVPSEVSESYLNKYDIGSQLFPNNFDAVGNKKSTQEEISGKGNRLISKTVSEEFLVAQNTDKSNNSIPKSNYIRNFSYSAMNVDISIRHSADHHVHVIKKIKVDFDVTEILTHNNLKQDTNSVFAIIKDAPLKKSLGCSDFVPVSEFTRDDPTLRAQDNISFNTPDSICQDYALINLSNINKPICNDALRITEYKKLTNDVYNNNHYLEVGNQVCKLMGHINSIQKGNIIPGNQSNSIHCRQVDENCEEQKFSEENNVNAQVISRITEKESLKVDTIETSENSEAQLTVTISSKSKLSPSLSSTNFALNSQPTEALTVFKAVDRNCAETRHIEKQNIAEFNSIIIPKTSEDTLIKAENKLEHILQKYSQAFRQVKKDEEKLKTKLPQVNNEQELNTQKNKRPFRITDIDKIEPKLPPLLITETPVYTTLPQSKEVIAEDTVIPQIPTNVITNETSKVTDIERKAVISEEEIELFTPIPSTTLITSHYNIDDSMLDPKTLLQCLSKDEPEIIPPPPEFSDFNYSPSQPMDSEDYNYESIVHNSLDNYENISNTPNHTYTDFAENPLQNSSNEIETILLSNNSNDYTKNKIIRPWAITQSSALRDISDRNCYTARRTRLNDFKFMNKKKFKH